MEDTGEGAVHRERESETLVETGLGTPQEAAIGTSCKMQVL